MTRFSALAVAACGAALLCVATTFAAPAATHAAHVTTLPDGLSYADTHVGTGARPKTGQTAVVHYVGTFPNGTKFDSSRDRGTPFEFPLGEHRVIPCWDEAVATMRVGGRRKLTCPPALAYGAAGSGPIPPNATLLFDVELLRLK